MESALPKSEESATESNEAETRFTDGSETQNLNSLSNGNLTWVRTSQLITAVCSTSIMGAAFAVPLATMSAPAELRGVVLSMSLGAFSTVMAATAGVALAAQRRVR